MVKNFVYGLIIALAILAGYFLSYICKDEIKSWKKRLNIITIISLFFCLIIYFLDFDLKIPVILVLLFVALTNQTIVHSIKIQKRKKEK